METLLTKLLETTRQQIKNGDRQELINSTVEELGEFVVADMHERGHKIKSIIEPAAVEAVDLALCAISLYFAAGGRIQDFENIAFAKLSKWQSAVRRKTEELKNLRDFHD